jgi:hypothetical protein
VKGTLQGASKNPAWFLEMRFWGNKSPYQPFLGMIFWDVMREARQTVRI